MDHQSLPRGKACLPCRDRRVKCDGVKPTCARCEDKGRVCTYRDEKSGRELQQEVASLESRVREAELRTQTSPTLHNLLDRDGLPPDWWKADEPPTAMRPHLMEIFSRFAGCAGFFLHPDRFARSFYAPEPFGHNSRPSRALLSAVYLTSVALSGSVTLTAHEPIFLSRALYHATRVSSCTHPSSAKHALQAEILLASYFFLRGDILEGKSHIDVAMSISTVHRIHKICKISNLEGTEVIEQWERVNGFWLAYFFDKVWSIAGGLPSTSPDGLTEEARIDTPWPLERQQFRNTQPGREVQGYDTINRFLANPASSFAEEDVSKCSMVCKAVTLLDRAHSLGSSWAAATSGERRANLTTRFAAMRRATQAFKDTIAPLATGANIQDPLIIIHGLVLLAFIRLDVAQTWTESSVENALAAVALLDGTSFEYIGSVNPVLGFLLAAIGQVLVDELIRIRGLASKSRADVEQEKRMKDAADRLIVALKACGTESPYISNQHLKLVARVNETDVSADATSSCTPEVRN